MRHIRHLFLIPLICLLACSAGPVDSIETTQAALGTDVVTPYGSSAVHAYVGSYSGDQWIVIQQDSTGACSWYRVGLGLEFKGPTSLTLGPSADYAQVVPRGSTATVYCPGTTYVLSESTHPIYAMTVSGLDGNDALHCGGNGWVRCYGGNGNDLLMTYTTTAELYGGSGDDKLIATASDANTYLSGSDGNDCLQWNPGVGNSEPLRDCGAGTADKSTGTLGPACEQIVSVCP